MIESQEDKYNGLERRESPRIKGITAVYSPIGKENLKAVGFVNNIGANGIKITVTQKIESKSILSLKMNLPGSNTSIQFKGRVIWGKDVNINLCSKMGGYELGTEFIEISDNDRQKISQYVLDCLNKNQP